MGLKLDGIFASEARDSSGEKLILKGMDISSLTQGVVNFEHKKDLPTQICGKILYAKKIFDEKDCDNERELYYWNKIQIPYLYGIVELFDNHEGADAIVAMLRYEQKNPTKEGHKGLINWSIDGVTLNKDSSGNITDCIARDLAFSNKACNKTCVGEELPSVSVASPLDAIKSLFKNENNEGEVLSDLDAKIIHLESLLKTDDISEFAKAKITEHLSKVKPQAGKVAPIQKEVNGRPSANLNKTPILPPKESLPWVPKAGIAPRPKATPSNPKGITSQLPGSSRNISGDEFKAKIQAFKEKAAKQNAEVKNIYKDVPKVPSKQMEPKTPAPKTNGEPTHFEVKSKTPKLNEIRAKTGPILVPISKAETAGTITTPGSNTGMSALAGQELKKQADDIYKNWDKKEDFEKFLSSKMPKLSKKEIQALAKMYSVATMQKKEEILKDI